MYKSTAIVLVNETKVMPSTRTIDKVPTHIVIVSFSGKQLNLVRNFQLRTNK